ncbi:MAG: ATP-binding cassette domain-containing protein, partial [Clostridia bacterium]
MKLNNIKKNLGEFELKDISLNLPDVGFVVINGESGSGKTTLLNIISMRMEAEG